MQPLAYTRHGRTYSHADEGAPATTTYTTRIGQVNVDVDGDGQTFAPYVVDGARLRHGDSECEFADGWQTIRRLGQVLVSKSRLYVQRKVGVNWTDVAHGIPTRNVAHDYPSEGRCTAYLDFPDIAGYAQGARLQVGVEVGGGDRQTYGFRFRSPQAGTYRLEWVLEIPENADLEWIEGPTSRVDPTIIRVGGRIGSTEIRWSSAEVPYRSATVESDSQGGRILHLVLGPYTVAAMEWLTIYPDTWGPTGIAADADDGYEMGNSHTWYTSGYTTDQQDYAGYWDSGEVYYGLSWELPELAASVTIDKCYIRAYCRALWGSTTQELIVRVEDADPATAVPFSADHLPSASSWIRANSAFSRTWSTGAWYFGESDTEPKNLAADLQDLITAYGAIAAGDRINVALWSEDSAAGSNDLGFDDYAHASSNQAQLSITYTAGVTLTVDPTAQAQDVEAPAVTQKHTLAVDHAAQAQAVEAPAITQKHALTVADLDHAQEISEPVLTHDYHLAVDDLAHAQAVEEPVLTQKHALTVDDCAQAQDVEAPAVTQKHTLTVADVDHGHDLEDGTATPSADLVVTQEGYRWRNNDGTEVTATWAAVQDAPLTAAAGAVRRLRFVINATGDPDTTPYQLEYKQSTDEEWTAVPAA